MTDDTYSFDAYEVAQRYPFSMSHSLMRTNFCQVLGICSDHHNSAGLDTLRYLNMAVDWLAVLDWGRDGVPCASCQCLHCESTFKLGERAQSRHRCKAAQDIPTCRSDPAPTILWLARRLVGSDHGIKAARVES